MQDEESIARLSFILLAKENSGKWGGMKAGRHEGGFDSRYKDLDKRDQGSLKAEVINSY